MSAFKGGDKLQAVLRGVAEKVSKDKVLRVGFLETAKYPDGTNVAQVAFWDEYGTKSAPPRPFFRTVIAEKSDGWGRALGRALKDNDYDADRAFALVGTGIKDQVVTSIVNTAAPALSPVTVMLRGMRSNDPSLVVTGKVVGEAAARVAAGKTNYGANDKPLIDSGDMQRSVDFDIRGGS